VLAEWRFQQERFSAPRQSGLGFLVLFFCSWQGKRSHCVKKGGKHMWEEEATTEKRQVACVVRTVWTTRVDHTGLYKRNSRTTRPHV
jgi:hypothetical protein